MAAVYHPYPIFEEETGRDKCSDVYVLVDMWPRRRFCMIPGRESSSVMAGVDAKYTRPPCGVLQCAVMLMHDILASVHGSCRHLHNMLALEPNLQFPTPLIIAWWN